MTKKIIISLSILLSLIVIAGVIGNSKISETEINADSLLKDTFKDKTVVLLSDLHIASIGKKEKEVLSRIRTIQPDIIFLTGDYVTWNGDYEPAMAFLSELSAEIGIWAVMGDYDYSNSRKSCLFCHKAGSKEKKQINQVRFLKNSGDVIEIDGKKIQIIGLDESEETHLQRILIQAGNGIPAIVLSHNPLNFELVDASKDVLMLSGDTHGGQIPLPSIFWGLLGYQKNETYNYGLYSEQQKKMFVTRGIGTSHLPIRLFCQPEVVVFRF